MIVKDARCIAVYGRRGSGKTTLVQSLLADCQRVVCFDPLGQYAREFRWPGAASLQQVHSLVQMGWRDGFRIAYTPAMDYVGALHSLSLYLWHAQEPYDRGRDRRKLVLVVEEMNLSYPARQLPSDLGGFPRLVLQGRHRGIEIIGVTQRPALVSADFRGMVAESYVFPLGWDEDRRVFGRSLAPAIGALANHHYLRVVDGRAEPGENPPLGKRRRA